MMQPVFPMLNIHVCKSISDLSKCDFSTDYNGNYNKDTKPLWVWFYSLTVKYNPTESFWGLLKLNGKFHYVNFIKLGTPISKIYFNWYIVVLIRI